MSYLKLFGPSLLTMSVTSELYRLGKISIRDAVDIELARIKWGVACTGEEEELGLLLPDEYEKGHRILESARQNYTLSDNERETLLIASLIEILRDWSILDDPPTEVENALEEYALDDKYGGLRLMAPMRRSEKTPQKYLERVEEAVRTGLARLLAASASRASGCKEV